MTDPKLADFECYLIGEDSMVDRCAEMILEENGILLGICSPNKSLESWGEKHGVRYTDSISVLESWMSENPGDFLFSVVNTKIIKKDILSKPRKFCVNFHNAPLPAYAGVHATAWAVLNREKYHGITWHILEEGIDTGPILKQEIFRVERNETNFSLNMKCLERGIRVFRELLNELKSGDYHLQPQDFSKRSYYPLYQKPKNYGVILWEYDSAEKICLLQRAMNFADHQNTFCLSKFVVRDQEGRITPMCFNSVRIAPKTEGSVPGEVVEISEQHLRVSTKTKDVIISKVSDGKESGFEGALAEVAAKYNIGVGTVLPSPDKKCIKKLKTHAEELAKHETYWIKSLKHISKLGLFSSDSVHSQRFKKAVVLKNEFVRRIFSDAPDRKSVTLAVLLLLYLYRLNNYDNYTVGYYAKCFGNFSKEVSPFFSNIVPLNVDLSPEITFAQAVEHIASLVDRIDKNLTFSNDISLRYPVLAPRDALAIRISLSPDVEYESGTFCFSIEHDSITLTYPDCLKDIDQTIVDNMQGQLQVFAEEILKHPESSVKSVKLLTIDEERRIKDVFNNTATDYPRDCSISELFEQQATKYSDKVALKHGNKEITYDDLNTKANQIARYLISLGVQKGNIIALYFNKGLNSVLGMLSVLKAGAAYVPIDPQYPKEYVNYTLKDTNAYVILTQERDREMLERCLPSGKFIIFSVDGSSAKNDIFQKNSGEDLSSEVRATDLAYIMYTSGSTGNPKGVMVPHRGVVRLVKNTNYISIGQEDCLSQVISISFDASTFEIWGALLNGAKLVFADNEIVTSTEGFSRFLLDEGITILTLVSAVLDRYASAEPQMFRNVKYVYVGGDVLNIGTVNRIMSCPAGSPRYIVNGYGPTENTNCTTAYVISKDFDEDGPIPIGKAISNTTVYVVDKFFNCMPVGVFGELCTSGDGLAFGYLNRPDLTSSKFIETVVCGEKKRVYRTGDLARWLPDGNIDFACRLDNQVKIRGFRIELEAIELQLLNCAEIEQCSVAVKEKDNRKSLIAYIQPRNGCFISVPNIRQVLKSKLAPYMIPNKFVIVDAFPKLPNGKVDKKSLVNKTKMSLSDDLEAPRNAVEVALVNLWKELLDLDSVGINENFFDLGGYSLLMTELTVKVKEMFHKSFSLPTFLESPTIEKLASLLSSDEEEITNTEDEDEKLFRKDVFLLPLTIPESRAVSHRKNILLTGATGFVGCHLLSDFYGMTDSVIHCLVRAIGVDDARQRLSDALKKHGLDVSIVKDVARVKVVLGDLSCPRMGIDSPIYEALSDLIDEVHHCGAQVHHIYTYDMLRKPNVLSTKEIIKFAVSRKLKSIHYVSAISSAIKPDSEGKIPEKFLEEGDLDLKGLNGYAKTKLASELVLAKAEKYGVPVFIYRLAWVIGDNFVETNSLSDNHLLLLLKGCAQMKAAPRLNANLKLMPVGMVSSFIVHVSETDKMKSGVFNLIDIRTPTWGDLVKRVQQQGYEIRVVSPKEWLKRYISKIDSDNVAYSLKPLYSDGGIGWASAQNEILNCCCANYLSICEKGFKCANENIDLLDNCKIIL